MINKIPSSIDYNYCLKRVDTQLNESTNPNSLKISKVVKITLITYFEAWFNKIPNITYPPPLGNWWVAEYKINCYRPDIWIIHRVQHWVIIITTTGQITKIYCIIATLQNYLLWHNRLREILAYPDKMCFPAGQYQRYPIPP